MNSRTIMIALRSTGLAYFLLAGLLASAPLLAARDGDAVPAGTQRYIVELQDPPLARYQRLGREISSKAGGPGLQADTERGRGKLDTRSMQARAYLDRIGSRQQSFEAEAAGLLGRTPRIVHRYRIATNGMALDLTADEAETLAQSPNVKSISPDRIHRLHTYAGPPWIGAPEIWDGLGSLPARQGENVIVGIIDSGINWEHPSFEDPSPDGYNHSNPLGRTIGLCSDPEVQCNDKLIGVWDFVEDNPSTEEEEENTKGRDDDGHGSHVAGIAVGNRLNVEINGMVNEQLSGVAPRANLISYRVCYAGNPAISSEAGCQSSAILSAIDQAMDDGVDVINYSIGSSAVDPWRSGTVSRAFLEARDAGIFVATSAGNAGPNESTVGSPANAPWMMAVGNASHNVSFGSTIQNLVGGDTQPPDNISGRSLTGGTGQLLIVHASDYGFPLCGTGEAELQAACEDNSGATNPWAGQKPFNGEIVVCDRGTYGRVEKGKNVLLAGAGGYILANTDEWGEALIADDHCLPAVHIGEQDGDQLRTWLATGSGHGGRLSGMKVLEDDRFGDQLSPSSSRGPALDPVEDILKPDVIAPGVGIVSAGFSGESFLELSGTSMSSPHVAGAAALLKSVHPEWGPSQLHSAITTTATAELVRDYDGSAAGPHERGAGRPQLGEAVEAGLYLGASVSAFIAADPAIGGEPRNLNLPSLVDANCAGSCSFNRTVTDQAGGGSWTATAEGFPDGVIVEVAPSEFELGPGQSRTLGIAIDVEPADVIGQWVPGRIRLSSPGLPDQLLTVTVFSSGGDLPASWSIVDDRNGGWKEFDLSGLAALRNATFTVGGLVAPTRTEQVLQQDPTEDDPFDNLEGVYTVWYELPAGGLWLYAETLTSTAEDIDLYVGRDINGNGIAEDFEELCRSITTGDLERCDLYADDLEPGDYWVLVQNYEAGSGGGDEAILLSAAIEADDEHSLAASGPGIVGKQEPFTLRLSWDNVAALPIRGERWLGAVGIGTNPDQPNNIGVIPVYFTRDGIAAPETFPLMNGVQHRLALSGGGVHDRAFIDIPPGATSLTVEAAGADAEQNDGLTLELVRLSFEEALVDPPFAAPAGDAAVITAATGNGEDGPAVTVTGQALQEGRWYAVLRNANNRPSAVELMADVSFQGEPLPIHRGLWQPITRPDMRQGFEYHDGPFNRFLIWYTFDEDGQPTWFYSEGPNVDGNIWVSDVFRLTNDGKQQALAPVGQLAVTMLQSTVPGASLANALFSFTLYGQSGTDRMQPLSLKTCPQENGAPVSYTGHWFPGYAGVGGASVVVNAETQAQIHYLYDDHGVARWLVAQNLVNDAPDYPELPLLQFSGFCAVCETTATPSETVGVLDRSFSDNSHGSWTLDYLLAPPLEGSMQRTDQTLKLTADLECLP